jgi:hypothetical protein
MRRSFSIQSLYSAPARPVTKLQFGSQSQGSRFPSRCCCEASRRSRQTPECATSGMQDVCAKRRGARSAVDDATAGARSVHRTGHRIGFRGAGELALHGLVLAGTVARTRVHARLGAL